MRTVILGIAVAIAACGGTRAPDPVPPVPTPTAVECKPGGCGPALGMPAEQCSDGSVGGNTGRCLQHDDGACGWEIRECPAETPAPAP